MSNDPVYPPRPLRPPPYTAADLDRLMKAAKDDGPTPILMVHDSIYLEVGADPPEMRLRKRIAGRLRKLLVDLPAEDTQSLLDIADRIEACTNTPEDDAVLTKFLDVSMSLTGFLFPKEG